MSRAHLSKAERYLRMTQDSINFVEPFPQPNHPRTVRMGIVQPNKSEGENHADT
jgi:hypothetical protein